MSKIKVGQVYGNKEIIYIITHIVPRCDEDGSIIKKYQAICNDGFCFEELSEDEVLGDKLVASYPTWQEAVNSKEFKNG